jgi:hypothetical protein
MNIIAFLFSALGLLCLVGFVVNFYRTCKQNGFRSALKQHLKYDWKKTIGIPLAAFALLGLGLWFIPGMVKAFVQAGSVSIPTEVVRVNWQKSFEVPIRQRFPDQSYEISKRNHENCYVVRLETLDRREFGIPEKSLQIKNKAATRVIGTLVSDQPWYYWPWRREYYTLTLE